MTIFITGGGGYLGTQLRQALSARGADFAAPSSSQCNLTRAGDLERFGERKYETIYHLAAWTQAGDFCLRHPGEQWILNQQINTNVLAWWAAHQPQAKLIYMGTSCAYAPGSDLHEDNYMIGEPVESLYTYAMTKRMLYQGARALQKQYGLRWLCTVPSTLYGPGYHTDGRQMHFIFDLIRKIIRGKELGTPVTLWGDGHQRREVVYAKDFVDALLTLAGSVDNDLVNIGAGEEFTIRAFAQKICDIVGYDFAAIGFDTDRYVGAKSKSLDISKLRRLIPGYRATSLEDGLRETIAWFYSSKAYLQAG